MRYVLFVVALLAAVALAAADAAYPLAYRRTATLHRGRIYPHPTQHGWLVVAQPKPLWKSAQPALQVVDASDVVHASALVGADVRAVVAHRGTLYAVVSDPAALKLVALDDTLGVVQSIPLGVVAQGSTNAMGTDLYSNERTNMIYVRTGGTLLAVRPDQGAVDVVETDVHAVAVLQGGPYALAYGYRAGPVGYLALLDTAMRARVAPSVPIAEAARIVELRDRIVVCTPLDAGRGTQLTLVDPGTSTTQFTTVTVPVELLGFRQVDGEAWAFAVQPYGSGYAVERSSVLEIGRSIRFREPLPPALGRPLAMHMLGNTCVVLMDAGMVTLDANGTMQSADTMRIDATEASIVTAGANGAIVVGADRASWVLVPETQPFWWLVRAVRDAVAIAVPLILLLLIAMLLRRIRRQQRFIDAMIDLPGTGMVLHMDADGRLLRTNAKAAEVLGITASVPMRRLFRSYALHNGVKALLDAVSAMQASRSVSTERVLIEDGGALREYMCTSIPLWSGFARFKGLVVTCVDITEALERRRLVNWAQLAHDMQTNLSTIRLNAEQLEVDQGNDRERRRRILFQVGVLIQRVRDLISVGRSEDLHRTAVHSAELCTDVRQEFDPAVFPHVTFAMKLRGTMMLVDRLKVSRAVRNAIENGIKALRGSPGTIEISTWFDRSNVYISVRDTGVGMDAETMENMMKPYFTTANDGSGTGIGTMIMQHVVHQHAGSLRVTSNLGEGTQVVFRFPHGMEGPRLRHAAYASDVAPTQEPV